MGHKVPLCIKGTIVCVYEQNMRVRLDFTPDEQCIWVEMNRIFQFRDTGFKCRLRGVY